MPPPAALYWNPLVPELTVKDLTHSLRFYAAAGFSVRFRRSDPNFAYIELGGAHLMLEEEHQSGWNVQPLDRPLGRGVNFQIETPSVYETATSLKKFGYRLYREPKENWYSVNESEEEGQIEFLIQDPDGYLMRFVEALGARAK